MLSYYRVYYNTRLTDLTEAKYVFIYAQLPSFQLSQQGICNFINQHRDSVSFKCELSRDVYAIARIIPFKKETRFPLYRECIYDLFMFPSPIRNKIPSLVELASIKTAKPLIIKKKVDELDPVALSFLDRLIVPFSPSDASVIEYYKVHGLEYQNDGSNIWDVAEPIIPDYTFESDSLVSPTANQLGKYLMMRISVDHSHIIDSTIEIPDLRMVDNLQSNITKLDFYRLVNNMHSGFVVVGDDHLIIIINCSNKATVRIGMKESTFINAKAIDFTSINDQLPTTINPLDPFLNGVYVYDTTTSSISSAISQIDSFISADVLGNMYVVVDWDTSLLESIFNYIILDIQ